MICILVPDGSGRGPLLSGSIDLYAPVKAGAVRVVKGRYYLGKTVIIHVHYHGMLKERRRRAGRAEEYRAVGAVEEGERRYKSAFILKNPPIPFLDFPLQ